MGRKLSTKAWVALVFEQGVVVRAALVRGWYLVPRFPLLTADRPQRGKGTGAARFFNLPARARK